MRGLGDEYRNMEASTGGDFERPPAGGYVCRIISATDYPDATDKDENPKPYLDIVYDVAEGDYAGYYSNDWGKDNVWAHSTRWYYTPKSLGVFKGNLKAVDGSNGTSFEEAAADGIDERKLAGCLVGLIIGEEEYESNVGDIRTRLKVRRVVTAAQIREGKFKIPELKKLAAEADPIIPSKPDTFNAEELPF